MTAIEWTDEVWNPTTGCDRVSPGCDHCYALTMAKRLKGMGAAKYQRDGNPKTSGPGFGLAVHEDALMLPFGWRKPRRIFVNSMSDLFHTEVSDDFIGEVFAVMALTPHHTFQLLTKRHARMRHLLNDEAFQGYVAGASARWAMHAGNPRNIGRWPLPNIWLGVSVENDKWFDVRVPALLDTPASKRFLSCEPLLGPINFQPDDHTGHERDYDGGPEGGYWMCLTCGDPDEDRAAEWTTQEFPPGIDWVIAGGESGPRARPAHPDWFRTIRDQCANAGVAFHFKQHGAYAPVLDQPAYGDLWVAQDGTTRPWDHDDGRTRRGLEEWRTGPHGAESALMRRTGKKAAGRELDGRTHDEFPTAVTT